MKATLESLTPETEENQEHNGLKLLTTPDASLNLFVLFPFCYKMKSKSKVRIIKYLPNNEN